jgi:hypothetical protein
MTLTVTIDRTSLSLSPLVLSGSDDANDLGITAFQRPGRLARIKYMPDSDDVHGSEAVSMAWQQAVLGFTWVSDRAEDEADVQAARQELEAALGQFSYTVTTQEGDAAAETWQADPGSMQLAAGGRTTSDLEWHNPQWSVTIPVYPIPEA